MTAPLGTFNLSVPVNGALGPIAVGDCVVPLGGVYVVATTANRTAAGVRAQGVAVTPWSSSTAGAVSIQGFGVIDAASAGLGAGTASNLRVSSAGRLERATVSGSDDVVGRCETDGTACIAFGFLTAAIVNGGGGGGYTPPTGTGFAHITSGAQDPAAKSVDLTADVTGTLPAANGGTGNASLTFPAGAVTIVARNTTETLQNKSISAASNTITGLTPANDAAASAMAALAIDWSVSSVFTKTLAAGANTITFSNASSGRVIMVRLTGAGTSTVTWPTVKWAGGTAPTQTASGTDVYTFVHDGTSIYGSVVQAMA